jgi:hypothetical protein
VQNTTRYLAALKSHTQRRASAARIAWHTLTRHGMAKLPNGKPERDRPRD